MDKTQVPTQFLKEHGYPFVPLTVYNGILVDSNRTDMTTWRALYASFLTSYVGGLICPAFQPLGIVNTIINNVETSSGAIPITILHTNYNDMRPDAVTSGLLSISNEQLFDVAGCCSSYRRDSRG
ncbi:MAG: hypothetical protein HC817_03550 [Saprospiraceae bacterium]|nr:hypothetical protein [Saprospiraceae bacterium]